MRIAIFGCRDGQYLAEQIRQNKDSCFEVICFCDNDRNYHNKTVNGIPVISDESLSQKYLNKEIEAVIVAVRKGYSRYCIIKQIKNCGIDNIILIRPSLLTYRLPIVFNQDDPLFDRQWFALNGAEKPIIHHLEAHAADGCNLNCKGCLHFSNLYPKDQFPDLIHSLEDVKEISRHCEIFQFRVLGGEPLLNPNLADYLVGLREILPDTDIAVITNGILIPKADKELFEIMSKNRIGFNITLYPPTIVLFDKIKDILESYNVPYGSHVAKTDEFERFMTVEKHDEEHKAYKHCAPRGILVVKDGKLFKCPIEAYGKVYDDLFDIGYQTSWDGIDIYDPKNDWNQIVEMLTDEPTGLCKYCSEKSEYYTWSTGKPKKEDWLIS